MRGKCVRSFGVLMGVMENGTQDLTPIVMEQVKTSENLAQDFEEGESPAKDKHNMDSDRVASETVQHKDVVGAQDIEKKLVSTEETSKEMGPSLREVPQNLDANKLEPLENVKILSAFENTEITTQNGMIDPEDIPPGFSYSVPGHGKLEPAQIDVTKLETVQIDVTNDFGHIGEEDREPSMQSRKEKPKSKGPVYSSWSLRSKSSEKPKDHEPINTEKEVSAGGEKKRRGRKKQQPKKNTVVNEFSRTKTHLRYLLHRIKYEQSLIDAYSAEGWRGQSLEKLKPEKELQRAKSHILRYKLKIRALFQQLDMSLAVGKLPASLFDSQGEIDSEDIFCAKCGSKDLSLDNDIILCDGACERGFHQFCLEPPLLKEHIPPGDEGWLCPGCDCKIDCIDTLKDYLGAKISIIDSWEKIFPEAAAAASGKQLDEGVGSSSDDSEDDDYDPDKPDKAKKIDEDESSSGESYFSAPDDLAASVNNDKYLGLPSDDSEDDDFDPSAPDQDKQEKEDSSSSDFSSDSEDLAGLVEDENTDVSQILPSVDQNQPSTGSKKGNSEVGKVKKNSLKDELSYLMETGAEPVSSKRRVERLDYKKLNDETFGNSSSDSSDEDFDDTTTPKRRKTGQHKNEIAIPSKTPIMKSDNNMEDENRKKGQHLPKRSQKNDLVGGTIEASTKVSSGSTGNKRSAKRLGEAVTQSLYASFNQNQYPERSVKENLARELGLTIQQVSKWFENARWSFHHRPKMESDSTGKPSDNGTTNTLSNQNVEIQQSSEAPPQNHTTETEVENSVTNTSGENSKTRKTRMRQSKLDETLNDIAVGDKSQKHDESPQQRGSKRQTRSRKV